MLEFLNFEEVSGLYERIFWMCVAEADLQDEYLSDEIQKLFHDGIIDRETNYDSMRSEAEDNATKAIAVCDFEKSRTSRKAAFLMHSLVLFSKAENNEQIADAVYYAIKASDNEQATAKKAEFLFPAT